MDRNIFLKNLKKSSQERDVPNITEQNAKFLRNLIIQSWATSLLEVGTANGYSTLHFAFEIEKTNWHITTIEFSSETYKEAVQNFKEMWVDSMITPLFWNALEILPKLEDNYDFIFIDAMKKHTLTFLLHCQKLIKKWGIIVIDDVIKFKHKMLDLYAYLEKSTLSYQVIPVDEDDGVIIIQY
jgi:predicted O-methyltransferase YrrM